MYMHSIADLEIFIKFICFIYTSASTVILFGSSGLKKTLGTLHTEELVERRHHCSCVAEMGQQRQDGVQLQ